MLTNHLLLSSLDVTDRQWSIGDTIHHPEFGKGCLTAGREGYLRALFATGEVTLTDKDELKLIPDVAQGSWSLVPLSDALEWRTNFIESRRLAELEVLRRLQQREDIQKFLDRGNLNEADRQYEESCKSWWSDSEYRAIREKAAFVEEFVSTLNGKSLSELDDWFLTQENKFDLSVPDFVTLKTPKVSQVFSAMGIALDEEQIRATAYPQSRLLITARAGSGKTRTLCAKAALSIHDEGLYPDQILILAFNKAAALTVKERLEAGGQVKDYRNARTFHSLAYQLFKPNKKLLFDAGGEPSAREQSRFAQRMLRRILNPAFKEAMVEFFRQELEQIEGLGRDLGPDDYMIFRRSLEHVTLKGERVKSNGEKFIADFLFEHGIEYRYERPWAWKVDFLDDSVYKPDFSIMQGGFDYVLEHWAINPYDPNARLPDHWTTSTQSYKAQITAKRAFWAGHSMKLMETHTGMLAMGRDAFENHLRDELERQGIKCERLSQTEIVRRVFENDIVISRMAELFLQFIQRAKKRVWSTDQLFQQIAANPDPEPRSRIFHDLALRAYREYEAMLAEESAMDFDDLLTQATLAVRERGAGLKIHLGDGRMIALSELRWIMLDEYQDFSELYFRMLEAILDVNPRIRLIAVGDDWQAINAFAGADLRFFQNFGAYFPDSSTTGVATNYRSDTLVVSAGNRLMAGKGMPAKQCRRSSGEIKVLNLKDVWIEFRPGDAYAADRESDSIYLAARENGKGPSPSMVRLAQALKLCSQIIQDLDLTVRPPQKAMILARTGKVYGIELAVFRKMLVLALSKTLDIKVDNLEQHVLESTAHGSKGQEAHTVIILDATSRQFPKVHPDNMLFRPFGVTPKAVLDEERRLFYVAITRAEDRLFVLTDAGDESPYLRALHASQGGNDTGSVGTSGSGNELGEMAAKIRGRIDASD